MKAIALIDSLCEAKKGKDSCSEAKKDKASQRAADRCRMAQTLDGADGLSMGRPESPLLLGEDETAQDDAAEIGGGRKRKGKSTCASSHSSIVFHPKRALVACRSRRALARPIHAGDHY